MNEGLVIHPHFSFWLEVISVNGHPSSYAKAKKMEMLTLRPWLPQKTAPLLLCSSDFI